MPVERTADGTDGRGGNAGVVVLAVVLAAAGIVAAIDRFGTPLPLPAILAAVPVVAGVVAALGAATLSPRPVLSPPGDPVAGLLLSPLLLVAAPLGIALGGLSGLALVAAAIAGGVLARRVVAPALGRTGAPTLPGAVREHFGAAAGLPAAVAAAAALLLLVAAEARFLAEIIRQTVGLAPGTSAAMVLALVAITVLSGGGRAVALLVVALVPTIALGYLIGPAAAAWQAGALPLPWLPLFGSDAFAGPSRMAAPATIVLAVLLVAGLAALPSLAAPSASSGTTRARRWIVLVAAVLLVAPAYALYGRAAGIDPAASPAALVLNFAAYAGLGAVPALLLAGALVAASALALALALAALGSIVAEDFYARLIERQAPLGRRAVVGRAAMLLAAILAVAVPGDPALLAALGLSVAAATAPVVVVGWAAGIGRRAATAGLLAGTLVVALDAGIALGAPGLGTMLGMTLQPTVLGPTGWMGLPVGASGAPAVLVALLAMGAMTLHERRPRRSSPAAATPSPDPS